MWNPFKRTPPLATTPMVDAEHEQLRRAIERCDVLCNAYKAKLISFDDLVATLERSMFSRDIIRKAIVESLGEDAAKKLP